MNSHQSCNSLGLQLHLGVVTPLLFLEARWSSAYPYKFISWGTTYWREAAYASYKNGPARLPCGTLKFSGLDVEQEPFTLTLHSLGCRYESNQFKAVPLTTNSLFRISSSIQWSTVLNAADKSMATNAVISWSSNAHRQSFTSLVRAVLQVWNLQYANWYWGSMLCTFTVVVEPNKSTFFHNFRHKTGITYWPVTFLHQLHTTVFN